MSRDEGPAEVRALATTYAAKFISKDDNDFAELHGLFCAAIRAALASRPAAPATDAEDERLRETMAAGWNACRKSLYAVCEDVDREADDARKHDGEHAKGYAAGMARAAKSIARGFSAMEAEDDDNLRSALARPAPAPQEPRP